MVRGGRQSTVRGALYESTSIAAVYGTICSLVWGTMGAALNLGTRVPGNLGGKEKRVSRDPRARWDKTFVVLLLCLFTTKVGQSGSSRKTLSAMDNGSVAVLR